MRALTLWAEWAWAVDLPSPDGTGYHPLAKRVENRTWKIPLGIWFALHAGKHIGGRPGHASSDDGCESVAFMGQRVGFDAHTLADYRDGGAVILSPFIGSWGVATQLQTGNAGIQRPIITSAILGLFRVTRYVLPGESDESDGVRGWKVPDQIGNVFEYARLREPVRCKGAQGLWQVPTDILDKCREIGTVKP